MLPRRPTQFRSDSDERLLSALFPPVRHQARLDIQNWITAICLADVIGATLLACAIFEIYAAPLAYRPSQLLFGVGCFMPAWAVVAKSQNLYRRSTFLDWNGTLGRPVLTCVMAFGLVLFAAFAVKSIGGFSRIWFMAWVIATLAWTVGLRLCSYRWLARRVRAGAGLERAMVLAGSPDAACALAAELEGQSYGRIRVATTASMPGAAGGPPMTWVEQPIRNGLIDRVFIADFDECGEATNALVARLARLAVDVTLIVGTEAVWAPVRRVGAVGMLPAVDVAVRPLSPTQATIKRLEDIVVAGAAVLLVLPVLASIALAIKLDSPGPVLFRQVRTGFHDRTFRVWKFRTMYHHLHDSTAKVQTRRGDPRVTRVGRLLRRTSLDELPQLFNVLRGEMSLVGPRPHALEMTAAGLPLSHLEDYHSRHRMRPGITGWAQVNGSRGEVDTQEKLRERVRLDCYYIDNWSILLDVWIVLRTVGLMAFGRGAY